MCNPYSDAAPQLAKHSLTLHPPSTTYGLGLADEQALVSLPHRTLAWSADVPDSQKRTMIRTLTGQVLNFKLISL